MPDLIAENVDAYVAQAVALGRDRDRRRHVAAEMSRRRGALYDDYSPVRALAGHLESVAAAAERS
jgi:predicted O-linked N-acetylglucosamine transferase (SPINDLY family)